MSSRQIIPLQSRPEFADTCAAWSFGEWGCHIPGRVLQQGLDSYRRTVAPGELPATWLCLEDDKPAGMARLKLNDHPDRTDLNPWLASVFVHPRFRGKGVASALCRHAADQARDIYGIKTLYLFTADADRLYERLGWRKTGMVRDPMGLVPQGEFLMQKDL